MTAWEGVTLGEASGADAGWVVAIDLNNKRLTGDVPSEFGRLTALKTLDLRNNRLR